MHTKHTHTNTHKYIYTQTYKHTRTRARACARTHSCVTRTYAQTYTHTHTHQNLKLRYQPFLIQTPAPPYTPRHNPRSDSDASRRAYGTRTTASSSQTPLSTQAPVGAGRAAPGVCDGRPMARRTRGKRGSGSSSAPMSAMPSVAALACAQFACPPANDIHGMGTIEFNSIRRLTLTTTRRMPLLV